jgi:hypothetical protein
MADPAFKAHCIADQKEAMIQGSEGVTRAPPAIAHHPTEHIPNCELHLLEGQGHLSPVDLRT